MRPPASVGGESSSQATLPAYSAHVPPQRLQSAAPARPIPSAEPSGPYRKMGQASDEDTPRPQLRKVSASELPVSRSDASGTYADSADSTTLDQPDLASVGHPVVFSSGASFTFTDVDHMDLDAPDRPDSPSPPSARGKSLQPSMSPLSKSKGKKFDASDGLHLATFTVGRTSTAVATVLDEGFEDIVNQFSELGNRTGMPTQQVISRFMKQFACTNSPNEWNLHQKYFAANKAREFARLPDFENVTATPSEKMPQCYKLF
ncbi:hypothetical protein HYDPIDRAFT_34028 [Hydnomerulius pinastri MD-312]|uniref:Uncharacterized protein n=1 Tax=Hydnomerulius pinastri MD-312 TaxID=994086 RepID=A0A0C9UZZ0_9AGAM|nr:hypothetical protein HYDPIDRAFT_34028 [Hydnomerulius pinastri MD-312]